MPVDIEALAREIDAGPTESDTPAATDKVDRGDDFGATEASPKADATREVDNELQKELAQLEGKETTAEPAEEPAKAAEKEPAKAEEPPRDPDTGKFIPKARFDEAVSKLRRKAEDLEAQLAESRSKHAPAEGQDVAALETQIEEKSAEYAHLLADGKLDESKAVLREINRLNRLIVRLELAPISHEQTAAVTRSQTLQEVVDLYKSEYPVFDDDSDAFDQEVVNWVARQQGMYQDSGMAPALALQEAADLAVLKFKLDERKPAKKVTKADKDAERTAAGVDKALKAAKAQPAALSDVGVDSDKAGMTKIRVTDLTQDDFAKLPESTLRRLRGDSF